MTLHQHAATTVDMVPHVDTLVRLAYRADLAVEFGVRTGVSTWALLDALAPDGALHSWDIDAAVLERVPYRVRDDLRWSLHIEDSLAAYPPGIPDLVFIDTSHEYHQTLAELQLAGSWGTPLIVLHDWALADVQDAVRGFCDRSAYRIAGIEESQWGLAWLRK